MPLGLKPLFRGVLIVAGCLVFLFVIELTVGAAPESRTPALQDPPAQEPITPIPSAPEADPVKLALGERLFADPRLSRDGSRACTSCHDIHTNGADANRRDKALDGSEVPFNTPPFSTRR